MFGLSFAVVNVVVVTSFPQSFMNSLGPVAAAINSQISTNYENFPLQGKEKTLGKTSFILVQ